MMVTKIDTIKDLFSSKHGLATYANTFSMFQCNVYREIAVVSLQNI